MADGFLTIPLKPAVDVDFVVPLKALFKKAGVSKNLDVQLTELNKLRALVVAKNLEKSISTVEALQRYHDQIATLETKVPSELAKIDFTWSDAFDKGSFFSSQKSLCLPFFVYERLCILFNLAALETHLAIVNGLTGTDEEMKTAAKWFQHASGICSHMAAIVTILPEEGLTGDLNLDTLAAVSAIMVAQAQEIFVMKAIRDHMKDTIISKISTQAEGMFAEALEKMTKEKVKYVLGTAWVNTVSAKQIYYGGLAQYFESKSCGTQKKIGEQLARLNLSLELFRKAQSKQSNLPLLSNFIEDATKAQGLAKRDNDFIYHEPIPTGDRLPGLDKVLSARLAKTTAIPAQLSANFTDLFAELYPISPISGKTMEPKSGDNKGSSMTLKSVVDASLTAMSTYLQQHIQKQLSKNKQ